jgi:hypothetical protein
MFTFLTTYWIWILLLGGMLFMHLGHRGHSGHGGGCGVGHGGHGAGHGGREEPGSGQPADAALTSEHGQVDAGAPASKYGHSDDRPVT